MIWNVLIVDDDMNFRYAMREAIPWADHGFQVVGEAVHGRQALEILEKKEVHIVLTDMEMPVMNGVELTEAIKSLYPDMIVVALSAFDDFGFVKESMRLGAEDYILKQEFDGDKIIESLENICRKHVRQRSRELDSTRETEEVVAYIQGKSKEFPENSQAVRHLRNREYLTVCLADSRTEYRAEDSAGADRNPLFVSKTGPGQWLFVCELPQTRSMGEKSRQELVMIGRLQSGFAEKVRMGLCDSCGSAEELAGMYRRARTALEYGIYFPKERTFHYLDMSRYEKRRKRDYVYEVPENLLLENPEDAESVLKDMKERLMENMPEEEYLNRSFVNLYARCTGSIRRESGEGDSIAYYEKLRLYGTLEEKASYTREAIRQAWEQDMLASAGSDNRIIRKAVEYIRRHYAEEISLGDVAEYVGLSDNYFSNLFKQEMDENLVSFINKVRVENAKRLLDSQSMKVSEVAEAVGYRNATYLSTIFRKVTGMSISEYRNRKSQ